MPLLGPAAIVITFDIEPAAIAEHDEWHSREHMPERLSITGFRRGTRWRSDSGSPGYLVLYEVADTEVLNSEEYLQRLNHPTPWTARMMKHYRSMTRGLCRVVASEGQGMGGCALLMRFAAADGREDDVRRRLARDLVPALTRRPAIMSASLLESVVPAAVTAEQKIRGQDAGMRFALFVSGYSDRAVAGLLDADLRGENLLTLGMIAPDNAVAYRLAASLTRI